jgi:hypothetical protein
MIGMGWVRDVQRTFLRVVDRRRQRNQVSEIRLRLCAAEQLPVATELDERAERIQQLRRHFRLRSRALFSGDAMIKRPRH